MIKFTKVKLHNFLSYYDAELPLDNQGVTLIEGVNNSNDAYTSSGSGKSSLLSAITYALYGKTVTGLTSNAVINKEKGTDCCVELYFDIDSNEYCIKRYRKGKNGNANKVRLYLNDKEITEATNPKTDKAILDLIGIQFNTYVNTISYGSSDEPVFSQATDKGKKEILENLANTTVYAKAREVANDELKNYKVELTSAENAKANAESMINQYRQLEQQDKERFEQEQARQNENKATLERLKSDRDNYEEYSKKRVKELEIARERVYKEEPTQNNSTELQEAYKYLDKINTVNNTLKANKAELTSKLNTARTQYLELKNKTVCPVCGQTLDEEHKQKELNKLVQIGTEESSKVKKVETDIEKIKNVLQIQQVRVNKLQQESVEFNDKYKLFQNKLNKIDQEITNITYTLKEKNAKVSTLTSNSQLGVVPAKCYNSDIKVEEEKLNNSEQEIISLTKKIDNYTILVNKVFSKEGITSVVLDLITPYLNEHANYYLSKLSGSLLSINMNTQKLTASNTLTDKFDLKVINRAGADSYQNCSAGERKRIDIAIAFAIQDLQQDHNNTATNIAIYDECFDGLDSIGCESVIEILKEKAKTIPSIFVITHNDTLKPLFDNSIKVTKSKQGISSIGE